MLDGGSSEKIIEFDGLVGCSSCLILRGMFSQPEMDIPFEGFRLWKLVGIQNNVRIP